MGIHRTAVTVVAGCLLATVAVSASAGEGDSERLIAAMLGETPLEADLTHLTQVIGGRVTGTEANLRSVEWALTRFREAGVAARKEPFTMPGLWLEKSARARVEGSDVAFDAAVAAMPFARSTPPAGIEAPLRDAGHGTEADFTRLGETAAGSWLLVETDPLTDIEGLFREYAEGYAIERRALAADALGVIYMSSRPPGALYRHNASLRGDDAKPMVVMERDAALRVRDLLREGEALDATIRLDLETGGPYESYNVIGEIPGSTKPEETVVVGAHLDSWDHGTGTLDNGGNVVMLIDLARQIQRLGIRPERSIRFALWNGEEQGLVGSIAYAEKREAELDRHVVGMSFDIGCGRISGFFTGGRPEVAAFTEQALAPVRGLGPYVTVDQPVVGTDNYNFMMQGVANLVGLHEPATYGPNYHASTDQLNECDTRTLRMNGAIVAAVTMAFANDAPLFRRQTREELEALIDATDLETQMRQFNVWDDWQAGAHGRRP